MQIAGLIVATVRAIKQLPDPEQVRRKVRTGQELNRSITVGDYLDAWLAGRKALREGTRRSYAQHICLYLKPHLGHITLERLRVRDIDRLFDAIDERNQLIARARETVDLNLRAKVKGQRLVSAATKQRIRATLGSAFSKAVRERLIEFNVAALVELPSAKAPKALVLDRRTHHPVAGRLRHAHRADERPPQTPIPARTPQTDRDPHQPAGRLHRRPTPVPGHGLDTRPDQEVSGPGPLASAVCPVPPDRLPGLSRGEACGLRWSDIDFPTGDGDDPLADHPDRPRHLPRQIQNRRRRATINLDTTTVKELRAHKARQNTERLAAGNAWTEAGHVFTTPTGAPVNPNEVTDQYEQLSMEAGLPLIRLHDLRHGAATFLLAAGYDLKVVQETLRLSTLTTVSDI